MSQDKANKVIQLTPAAYHTVVTSLLSARSNLRKLENATGTQRIQEECHTRVVAIDAALKEIRGY